MTTVYFVRHAEADNSVRDGKIRPLTEKGITDRALVTAYLQDKKIDNILSSPFKRAIDTIADFAEQNGLNIETIEDFRERKSDSDWIRDTDFWPFIERQWADFSYSLSDGESLSEVQNRNITALNEVLVKYTDKNVVIGTHGTALSTIINYYDNTYGFEDFMDMVNILPWVVKMKFDGVNLVDMWKIDLFAPNRESSIHTVITPPLGTFKGYEVVVIFSRYKSKWLYCRAKTRDVFEMIGGGIENGETPLEAAKRELYEETGAVKYSIQPICDYRGISDTHLLNGQLFYAEIEELAELPKEFEMAEVRLFDAIPDQMRFPELLPTLYEKVQMWLSLQSAKDEIWDVYDSERNLTGRTHRRADPLPAGDYHLVVHVWLQNSSGEFLITKRAPNKGYPDMWECTGGSAITGDDSVAAAVREVKEETGLDAKPENGMCVFTITGEDTICDVWLFRQDFNICDIVLQENETTAAKYATTDEIRKMIRNNEFIGFHYIEDLFEKAKG